VGVDEINLELVFVSILVMHLPLVLSLENSVDVGFDLRTKEVYDETWKRFDKIVGFKYLSGLHLNDSRSTLGSQRDLHANLGYHLKRCYYLMIVVVFYPSNHFDYL
jgi:hypothetical protein